MSRWPWQVTCPTCGAGPGWPCKDPTGATIVGSHHAARVDFAKRT